MTPWTATRQASLSFTISWSWLKLRSTKSMMPSNHHSPIFLLPSIIPNIRIFSNESALRIRWPKYWSFNFSINPSSEYSGLISFRTDFFALLAVQGTPERLLTQLQFLTILPTSASGQTELPPRLLEQHSLWMGIARSPGRIHPGQSAPGEGLLSSG